MLIPLFSQRQPNSLFKVEVSRELDEGKKIPNLEKDKRPGNTNLIDSVDTTKGLEKTVEEDSSFHVELKSAETVQPKIQKKHFKRRRLDILD